MSSNPLALYKRLHDHVIVDGFNLVLNLELWNEHGSVLFEISKCNEQSLSYIYTPSSTPGSPCGHRNACRTCPH